jgi:hypothetical protein
MQWSGAGWASGIPGALVRQAASSSTSPQSRLYRNDRQIKDVTCREVQSDAAECSVTVRTLP